MEDPARIALYLRTIAGEIAEAVSADDGVEDELVEVLDPIITKLLDLADVMEAERG